ncbi:MAG: hypothetical protein SGJ19_11300, partial [Planctomycetia bacterium]|nr:hypothetical protein [Planctomycetia bacterium]
MRARISFGKLGLGPENTGFPDIICIWQIDIRVRQPDDPGKLCASCNNGASVSRATLAMRSTPAAAVSPRV